MAFLKDDMFYSTTYKQMLDMKSVYRVDIQVIEVYNIINNK